MLTFKEGAATSVFLGQTFPYIPHVQKTNSWTIDQHFLIIQDFDARIKLAYANIIHARYVFLTFQAFSKFELKSRRAACSVFKHWSLLSIFQIVSKLGPVTRRVGIKKSVELFDYVPLTLNTEYWRILW